MKRYRNLRGIKVVDISGLMSEVWPSPVRQSSLMSGQQP